MRLVPVSWFLASLITVLLAQESLHLRSDPQELLSTDQEDLSGIIADLRLSPSLARFLAFTRQTQGDRLLYLYDLDARALSEIRPQEDKSMGAGLGSNLRRPIIYNGELEWRRQRDHKDRQWFVFVSNGDANNRDLYLGYVGGEQFLRLTFDDAADRNPRWSPDGNSIAFISERSGSGDIYLFEGIDNILRKEVVDDSYRPVRLTDSAFEENDLAWNPNPASRLLAYSKREHFPGRPIETFQIRVMDVRLRGQGILDVTDDPLWHFTRPAWDLQTGSRLAFVGQAVTENLSANLYVAELVYGKDDRLQNKILEGYKTEVFQNIDLGGTPYRWLAGGASLLCREERPEQNYPLYSVNVERWINKEAGAVSYFSDLHGRYPFISEFDVEESTVAFVYREGEHFKVLAAQMEGADLRPAQAPDYALSSRRGGTFFNKYVVTGGAVAAGVITYLVLSGGSDENRGAVPIGLPPSLPR